MNADKTRCAQPVKLGNKERFDKEQICIKEPFTVTNLPFLKISNEQNALKGAKTLKNL